MKQRPKQIILRSLMFTAIGAAGLIVIDQATPWPQTAKLIWPIGWLIIAFLNIIICLYQNAHTDNTPKTSSTKSSWLTAPAASSVGKSKSNNSSITEFAYILGVPALIALIIMGGVKLMQMIQESNREFIKNSRTVVVTNPMGISSGCDQKVASSKILWFDPEKTYDVFELESGQHWKWYFKRDMEYRIMATGREPFIAVQRGINSGRETTADRKGMLQVRTKTANNEVEAYRLTTCTIK